MLWIWRLIENGDVCSWVPGIYGGYMVSDMGPTLYVYGRNAHVFSVIIMLGSYQNNKPRNTCQTHR